MYSFFVFGAHVLFPPCTAGTSITSTSLYYCQTDLVDQTHHYETTQDIGIIQLLWIIVPGLLSGTLITGGYLRKGGDT
jgi:hypothetical protein